MRVLQVNAILLILSALAVPAIAQQSAGADPAAASVDYVSLREGLSNQNKALTGDIIAERNIVKRNQNLLKEAQKLDAANKKLIAEKQKLTEENANLEKQRAALAASQSDTAAANSDRPLCPTPPIKKKQIPGTEGTTEGEKPPQPAPCQVRN